MLTRAIHTLTSWYLALATLTMVRSRSRAPKLGWLPRRTLNQVQLCDSRSFDRQWWFVVHQDVHHRRYQRQRSAHTDNAIQYGRVASDTAVGTTIGTLSATDADAGDSHTFTLVTAQALRIMPKFTITGNQLRTAASLSGQSTYSIRVRATDAAGLTFEQVITGTVTTGNVAPTDIALSSSSVAENTASGTTVGSMTSTDVNSGDTHTYELVSGAGDTDNGSFTIWARN